MRNVAVRRHGTLVILPLQHWLMVQQPVLVVPGAGHAVLNPQNTALAPEFSAALAAWLTKYVKPAN